MKKLVAESKDKDNPTKTERGYRGGGYKIPFPVMVLNTYYHHPTGYSDGVGFRLILTLFEEVT